MEQIIQAVLDAIPRAGLVEVEVSARHVHLTREHLEILFGKGAELTPKRPLSQPGQFLSEERVTLIGPKGRKERTAILGRSVRPHRSSCPRATVSSWVSKHRYVSRVTSQVRVRFRLKAPAARSRLQKAQSLPTIMYT